MKTINVLSGPSTVATKEVDVGRCNKKGLSISTRYTLNAGWNREDG